LVTTGPKHRSCGWANCSPGSIWPPAAVPVLSSSDFGVVIDSRLSLSDHDAAVCRSGYYQLRQFRPVARCSSEDAAKTMIQAFVIIRLDYCNALCYGITDELTDELQSVQNAAARLVTGTRRCDHYLACAPPCRCTGFLCGSASCSRLQPSSTVPCPATPRVT